MCIPLAYSLFVLMRTHFVERGCTRGLIKNRCDLSEGTKMEYVGARISKGSVCKVYVSLYLHKDSFYKP